MPTLVNEEVSEARKPRGAGNGNGGNGHGVRERVSPKAHQVEDDDSMLVLQEIMRLVDASKEGRLSERGKATLFNGTHREIIQGVNEMLDAILLPIGEGNRVLAQISSGKIDELITQTYKGDHEKMKVAVNNVAMVTQGLQKEMARLIDASKEGQLSDRGKPEQFQGAYAEIVRGVNTMLDAILLPIGEGNRILAQISNGKIDELIAADLQGRPRKDEGRRQQCGHRGAELAEGTGAADRSRQGRATLRARQARSVQGRLCRDRARRQRHSGCRDCSAQRSRQLCGPDQPRATFPPRSPTPTTATSMSSRTT